VLKESEAGAATKERWRNRRISEPNFYTEVVSRVAPQNRNAGSTVPKMVSPLAKREAVPALMGERNRAKASEQVLEAYKLGKRHAPNLYYLSLS
jgi:hypothetical protein